MRNSKGISILEVLLAITIITTIILGVGRYYVNVRENMRITQALEVTNNVAGACYKWLEIQNKNDFTGITLTDLVDKYKLLPAGYTNKAPWGGTISFEATNTCTILIPNVPANSCTNLVSKIPANLNPTPAPPCINDPSTVKINVQP